LATSAGGGSHEDFAPKAAVHASSDRAFGLVFAAVFAIVAAWPLFFGHAPRWWAAGVAAAFAVLALALPRVLSPLNRLWTRLGALLHAVVSPVVLSVIFYGVVWPTALVMRLRGRDPLRLKFDRAAPTYWVDRVPPGPPPASFRDPF
jgi:predicted membrane metal-binding protein